MYLFEWYHMGSCSSVHRTKKLSMKTDIPLSPIKDKPINGKSQSTTTFKDYGNNNGSKEEAFFDSKSWLDSDFEDDFYSVNEFTPSRGNTPVHHIFGIPLVNKSPSENVVPCSVPELSLREKKKNLLDLFRESVRKNQGSKEEAFFDSKSWLDSDCEDDFYSVNGEFTPSRSRGTTPVQHTFGIPLVNNKSPSENLVPCSVPELSLTEKKKSLLDLFRESDRENKGDDMERNTGNGKKEVKSVIDDILTKSERGTPYISGSNSACSSERTINDDHASSREKSGKFVQHCFPSLSLRRSFSERRRRRTSPAAVAANGKG